MENFNWSQFTKRIYINADMKTVYDAWTKSELLEKWFLSNAVFVSKADETISPSENIKGEGKYQWTWFAQNHTDGGKVNGVNGKDTVNFSFAGNCQVVVKLTENNNQTLLELTQTEIPLDDKSKKNIRLGCAFGWSFYLVNLKSVLEGGLDLRNKDTALKGVVNN